MNCTKPHEKRSHSRHLSVARILGRPLNFVSAAAIICLALLGMTARAQTTCIPNAIGIPGQSTAPNWFDTSQPSNGPTRFNDKLEDPRWRGAVNHTYGTGTAEQVSFRALHSTVLGVESLYLSWNIKVSPSLVTNVNQLFVGFSPGGGLDDVVINVRLNNSANGNATTNSTRAIQTKLSTGNGTTYTGVGEPAWLPLRTRMWVDNSLGAGMGQWAVQMVIPINAALASGLNLSTPFKMWFEVDVAIDSNTATTYRWPRPANPSNPASQPEVHNLNTLTTGIDSYPETSTWGDFRLTNGDADNPDPMCPTTGVSLRIGDVGTTNSPTSKMKLLSPNTFVANARNNTGSSIPSGQLLASFYLANWGTQILVDDPTDPNGPWQPILGLQDVPSSGATADGTQANISMAKTFSLAERLPYLPPTPTKNLHQCIFVKLRSLGPLTFTNDSVARNMDFENASKMVREADVSVVGLPDMPASPTRDVYLYVEAANMPPVAKGGQGPVATPAATGGNRGQVSGELDPVIPTYRVHAYHDTGRKIIQNGLTIKIVSPQSSFGYYVIHNGPLAGWKYSLEGAQEIGPNLYLIAVPNHSAAKIITTIEAVESGGGGGSTGPFKRWGLSLHAGISIPHGNFNAVFDPGPNFAIDLEYRVKPTFSLEAIYGLHHFNGATIGSVTVGNLNVHQFSFNGKVYGSSSPVRPFVNFGGGAYKFGSGSTRAGLNIGAGVQFDVTPTVAAEAMYDFHNVFTSGSSTRFSAFKAGFRFRF
jgi:hypothetical protein